jgi:hypothetical protein
MKAHLSARLLVLSLAALIAVVAVTLQTRPALADSSATCSAPQTVPLRESGRFAVLDQCYAIDFDHDGTTYDILVFYTEDPTLQTVVDGETMCDDDDTDDEFPSLDQCEHALPDIDDANGDNIYAVQVADQVAIALPFYFDRNFPVIDPETVTEVWVVEDKKNGGIKGPNVFRLDDEKLESTNVDSVLSNVFHEGQHLVQRQYYDKVGFEKWFAEGIARTSQDRTAAAYDALLSSSYMSQFGEVLSDALGDDPDNGYRSSDLLTISYRATAFWTWYMDHYRTNAESEPGLGWNAVQDFYETFSDDSDSLALLDGYLQDEQGSSFSADFTDYTLALYAYIYNPADPRLGFVDAEINAAATGLSNHTVVTGNQAFAEETATLQPRSAQYWEYIPPPTCPFVAYTFEESTSNSYAFSVLTVDTGGTLQDRWTSPGSQWARTVSTSGLSRTVGVVTGLDGSPDGQVTVGHGCVTPDLQIKTPTTGRQAFVGEADNPRQFQVRLAVTGPDGSGVGGLTKDDFEVQLLGPGGPLTGGVLTAAYVGDDYWLNVMAPAAYEGAQTGQFYDLRVTLGSRIDTQNDAVLYVERQIDQLIVLDKSGSMADDGRIESAQNAAALMTTLLSNDDQGAYIRFDDEVDVAFDLDPMSSGNALNMVLAIRTTTPGGETCIGCGLQAAADEEDQDGSADNLCVIALLSDGYENESPFWDDVADEVSDNECYMDVIGLGTGANEALLQTIANSSSGGGHYDFAATQGSVPIDTDSGPASRDATATTAAVSWENYLSRAYDAMVTRAAGRQRTFSAAGTGFNEYPILVDPTTDELVVSIAWQTAVTGISIGLNDPDGLDIPQAGHRTVVSGNTGEVWRVVGPKAGQWTLRIEPPGQLQYHVSATARTLLEMQLYAVPPADNAQQGVKVPIIVTFSGNGDIVTGAEVKAVVVNPNNQQKQLTLYDDGLHGDMDPDDGVYGNWYTQTTGGETVVEDATGYADGEEPESRGSYIVTAVAHWQDLRREAQTSFFLAEAQDSDGDRLPDWWEVQHGLDPNDPSDAGQDRDGDGASNACEWNQGTLPDNSDTDGGGESDGSEMPNCQPKTQDPLEPGDDRIKPLRAVVATPGAALNGDRWVDIVVSGYASRARQVVSIYRRPAGDPDAPWVMVADQIPPPSFANPYRDRPPNAAEHQVYMTVIRNLKARQGSPNAPNAPGAPTATVTSGALTTPAIHLSGDPYAPYGTLTIVEAPVTTKRVVTLRLTVSDDGDDDADGDESPQSRAPGSPPASIHMMISTDPQFRGAVWQPYQSQVDNFDLGDVRPGDIVTVYVRFRDEAGNIGRGGEALDSVQISGLTRLFLPAVRR